MVAGGKSSAAGRILTGIGGWIYEPWRQTFYPSGLSKARELHHASRQLGTIEINATFYRTQAPQIFRKWAAEVPDDFVFALKASRYACSRKDLADGADSIARFLGSGVTELGPKLGPILWQLAGSKKYRPSEIEGFLALLPKVQDGVVLRHAIEPRHSSFRTADFIEAARRHGVAIVLAEAADYPLIADPTANFHYLRLQTTRADEPTGYGEAELSTWRDRCRILATGETPADLPLIAAKPDGAPRDCFVYVIAGAKERNPAAAIALADRLARQGP